jgi:hypothetical protein
MASDAHRVEQSPSGFLRASQVPLTGSSRHNASVPLNAEAVAAQVESQMLQGAAEIKAVILETPELSEVAKPLFQQFLSTMKVAAAGKAGEVPHPFQVSHPAFI